MRGTGNGHRKSIGSHSGSRTPYYVKKHREHNVTQKPENNEATTALFDALGEIHLRPDREVLQKVTAAIASGANVNAIDKGDQKKETALHIAAERGRVDVVQVLLENGADKSVRNAEGETPREAAEAMIRHLRLLGKEDEGQADVTRLL